jgi:hypothetical protein
VSTYQHDTMIRASASISLIAAVASGFTVEKHAPCRLNALSSVGSSVNDPWPNRSPFSSAFRSQSPFPSSSSGHDAYSASIPFMVTHKMKRELIEDLRYTRREVEAMSAERAASIIANRIARPLSHNRINTGEVASVLPVSLPTDPDSYGFKLEEMDDQFGEVAERVLHDDQYGPLFSHLMHADEHISDYYDDSTNYHHQGMEYQVNDYAGEVEPENYRDATNYQYEEMEGQVDDFNGVLVDQYMPSRSDTISVDPIGTFERSDGCIIR